MPLRYDFRNAPVKHFRYDFRNELPTGGRISAKPSGMQGANKLGHIHKSAIVARLREIGSSQRKLAAALNVSPPRVTELLDGGRKLTAIEAALAADHLRWTIDRVHQAFGIPNQQKGYGKLPLWGYIDASSGQIIIRTDVSETPLEEIDAPFPGYTGKCVKIKGNSMAPRYRDGEAVGFTPDSADLSQLINYEVVACTIDGRILLKILHRGDTPHRYTLTSLNPEEEPILNVELEWVAPVDWHLPRRI